MSRKRLTAATLESQNALKVGIMAAHLSQRLLGPGASDDEIVTAGRILKKAASDGSLEELHKLTAKVASDMGDKFPIDDDGEPDPSDTQSYVAEHELSPDKSVLDVVLHKKNPVKNPAASKVKACGESDLEASEDEDVTAGASEDENDDPVASLIKAEDESEDEIMPDIEEPSDMEDGLEEEFIDEDSEMMEDGFMEEPSLDPEMDEVESIEDDDFTEDETDLSAEYNGDEAEDYYAENGEDDDKEFTTEDLNELESLGVEGVMTSSKKSRKEKKTRTAKKGFRPSRVRFASQGSSDEFGMVFDAPDVNEYFMS